MSHDAARARAHEPTVFTDLVALEIAARDATVLYSAWRTIDQATIDAFAETTGDRQWIHTDPERARRESPYGTTIAHGFLSLSLLAAMIDETFTVSSARLTINYGFDRVRFLSPVPVGARIRGSFSVAAVTRAADRARVTLNATVEIADCVKPALVALWIFQIVESTG